MSEFNDKLTPSEQEKRFEEQIDGEFEGRALLFAELDARRIELSDQLSELAARLRGDPTGRGVIDIDVSTHRETFEALVKDILGDEDVDCQPDDVACLVQTCVVESKARLEMMDVLLEEDAFEPLTEEIAVKIFKRLQKDSENYDDLLERIADMYENDLRQDIQTFIQAMLSKYQSGSGTGMPNTISEITKELRGHAVDFAKIAAGVTVALVIDRFLRRKS